MASFPGIPPRLPVRRPAALEPCRRPRCSRRGSPIRTSAGGLVCLVAAPQTLRQKANRTPRSAILAAAMHRGRYASRRALNSPPAPHGNVKRRLVRQRKLACRKAQDAAKPARATSLRRAPSWRRCGRGGRIARCAAFSSRRRVWGGGKSGEVGLAHLAVTPYHRPNFWIGDDSSSETIAAAEFFRCELYERRAAWR